MEVPHAEEVIAMVYKSGRIVSFPSCDSSAVPVSFHSAFGDVHHHIHELFP